MAVPATPAVRQGFWVGVAVGLYGISFGALAVAAGLDTWQAVALSALMVTGGSQFAFVGGLPILAAVLVCAAAAWVRSRGRP